MQQTLDVTYVEVINKQMVDKKENKIGKDETPVTTDTAKLGVPN